MNVSKSVTVKPTYHVRFRHWRVHTRPVRQEHVYHRVRRPRTRPVNRVGFCLFIPIMEPLFTGIRRKVTSILNNVLSRGARLTQAEAAILLRTRGREAQAVAAAADALRKEAVGDCVTYAINRNINFTNVCVKRCGFCAFSRTGIDEEGYFLPESEVVRRAKEAWDLGASEVCIQAGLPPNMAPDLYPSLVRAIKKEVPAMHVHAFSPEEVLYGAKCAKLDVRDFLMVLKEAGVDSLPGTSAEILVDEVRNKIAKGRLTTAQWVNAITNAHEVGLRTTATMMYGHIETPEDIATHLQVVRDIQDRTGGFTEFVPLSFVAREAPMYKQGLLEGLRGGPSGQEVMVVHAVSRLFLHNSIHNIQVSWVKEGLRMAQVLLACGVNDLGGLLMNESISLAAGAAHGQMVRPSTLEGLIRDAGRVPLERRTDYSPRHPYPHAAAPLSKLEAIAEDQAEQRLGSFHKLIHAPEYRFKRRREASSPLTAATPSAEPLPKRKRGYATAAAVAQQQRARSADEDDRTVTFSRSYTLVPTYECFNVCGYCNFRRDVGQDPWMTLEEARTRLQRIKRNVTPRVWEVLVMSGEIHPRSERRGAWMDRVVDICKVAMDEGFLPHTNVGPVSPEEMERLQGVNASMGLMLEQAAPLPHVHRSAPSKAPGLRLRQLEQAGAMRIPFTTGILCGIGETGDDRVTSLEVIARVAEEYGHIQECIIQPHRLGPWQRKQEGDHSFDPHKDLPQVVALARQLLPSSVVVQVPPNLVEHQQVLLACLAAGARDLGGISPLDEVNATYPFPAVPALEALLTDHGYVLKERLATHVRLWDWMPKVLQERVRGMEEEQWGAVVGREARSS